MEANVTIPQIDMYILPPFDAVGSVAKLAHASSLIVLGLPIIMALVSSRMTRMGFMDNNRAEVRRLRHLETLLIRSGQVQLTIGAVKNVFRIA